MTPAQVADTITELKLGNGTSVLIFANIASALPSSVGGALSQVCPALNSFASFLPHPASGESTIPHVTTRACFTFK